MAAYTTTSNVSTTNLVGRELSIASSFVKQYYTLLNKAPCLIYNFYSHDSTFIHGTIEMANEHYTEPAVGREKIKRKMEDLKLNDCRAKIKQIDCLETLAGGLVIQVIGELSNNGKSMRRFLQTFVLAPSSDDSSATARGGAGQDGDSQQQHARTGVDRRGVHLSENNSGGNNNSGGSSHNQKFYVLNSIFRYQDDGPDSEFEDDAASLHANTSTDGTNGGNETSKLETAKQAQSNSNGAAASDYSQSRRRPAEAVVRSVDEVERLANVLEDGVKLGKPAQEGGESKRDLGGTKVVSNGMGGLDKKSELSTEKSTENGKPAVDNPQTIAPSSAGPTAASQQPTPAAAASRPQPSNEPKTWAKMVGNAHPPSAPVQMSVNKPAATSSATEQQHLNLNQSSSVQSHHHQQQQQSPQQQQQQTQPQQPQQQQQQQQQGSQNNRNRRHMVRKPSNKPTGRQIKNRPRPPATGKPVA